jgi:hypothetical protein
VPYADFFNHDPTMKQGNYYLDRVDNKFKVFASRDYNTGEEVMITYYGVSRYFQTRSDTCHNVILIFYGIGWFRVVEHGSVLLLRVRGAARGRRFSDNDVPP